MGNVTVVNAGKSNAHSPGSIAFVVWIAFSKSVKNHIAHSSESFSSNTTWTECFRAFLNFEITSINHHASTPLSVHASDLAVKEAFETEVKYWAAIASEIHPRIASRGWTPEQRHYAFWLLKDEHRFSHLILDRAPINEKISLSVRERKQVQNYLRRRARRVMKARPRVKIARSFALDNTLYAAVRTL